MLADTTFLIDFLRGTFGETARVRWDILNGLSVARSGIDGVNGMNVIRSIVRKYSAIPIEQLRVLSRFEDVGLPQMGRGVVFVFAAWSGPAIVGLKRFTRVLSSFETELPKLDLVVLDTDCLTADSAAELFGNTGFRHGGAGETIWVRSGCVVARGTCSYRWIGTIASTTHKRVVG